jgi:hypothetical protein
VVVGTQTLTERAIDKRWFLAGDPFPLNRSTSSLNPFPALDFALSSLVTILPYPPSSPKLSGFGRARRAPKIALLVFASRTSKPPYGETTVLCAHGALEVNTELENVKLQCLMNIEPC